MNTIRISNRIHTQISVENKGKLTGNVVIDKSPTKSIVRYNQQWLCHRARNTPMIMKVNSDSLKRRKSINI
jgi:hypothetical protein